MSWDDMAERWEAEPAVRAYAEQVQLAIGRVATAHRLRLEGFTVCDFGCGTGLLTEWFAPMVSHVDAVDPSGGMRAVLAAKAEASSWGPRVALHDALPSPAGPYDLIAASSVLAFVEDFPGTVRALADALKPGGLLMHWDWERGPDDEDPEGLTRGAIADAHVAGGLEVLELGAAFELPVEGRTMTPLWAVSRKPA